MEHHQFKVFTGYFFAKAPLFFFFIIFGLLECIHLLFHLMSVLIEFKSIKVAPFSIRYHLTLIVLFSIDVERPLLLLYSTMLLLSLLTSFILHLFPEGV